MQLDTIGSNDVLFAWHHVPARFLAIHLAATLLNGVLFGVRVRRVAPMLRGLSAGLRGCVQFKNERQPVTPGIYRLHRMLRARRAVPLSEIERFLPELRSV